MKSAFLLYALLMLAVLSGNTAENWPAFRGPNSSGVSQAARPPVKFGPDESVAWRKAVPWSPSSPCIWGERIFLTTFSDGRLETRCYSRNLGNLVWTRIARAEKLEEFHQTEGSPAASTPTTDGRRVVSYFGSCGLLCYDVDGNELWRYLLPVAITAGNFGSGTSPIIVGDRVILNRDVAVNSSILAVDLATGKKIWETPRPESPTSYSSPIVWNRDGVDEIVMSGSLSLNAYDVKSGAQRWVVHGLPSYTCTTPVIGDGLLYFAGWSPGKADSPWPTWASTAEKEDKNRDGRISIDEFSSGPVWFRSQDIDGDGFITNKDWDMIAGLMKKGENVMLAVKPGGSGDITQSHVVWQATRGLPYVPSPLFYDGRVYLVKDGGMMSCFDAKSGKPFYLQERLDAGGNYYASPVAADGRIYLTSLDGKVSVVKAGGDHPEVLHRVDFRERIASTPALIGGRLFLRTESALYAFGN
jgi:outer membrane protein assembly factor BamB